MFPALLSKFSFFMSILYFGLVSAVDIKIEFPEGRANNYGLLLVSYIDDFLPVCADALIPWTEQESTVVRAAKVACTQAGYEYGWTEQYDSYDGDAFSHIICGSDDMTLQDCTSPVLESAANDCSAYAGVYCFETVSVDNYIETSGTIQSPGYPLSMLSYPNAAGCTYIIDLPTRTTVTITFTKFSLKLYDSLYFGRGNIPQSPRLATGVFTNSVDLPDPFELTTDSFWFRFYTDLSETDVGFSLQWNDNTLSTGTPHESTRAYPEISVSSTETSIPLQSRSALLMETLPISTHTYPDIIIPSTETSTLQSGSGVIIGVSVGVVILLIICAIAIIIYLKSRNQGDTTSKIRATGLAFDGPYDTTLESGTSTFAENHQRIPSYSSHIYKNQDGGEESIAAAGSLYHDVKEVVPSNGSHLYQNQTGDADTLYHDVRDDHEPAYAAPDDSAKSQIYKNEAFQPDDDEIPHEDGVYHDIKDVAGSSGGKRKDVVYAEVDKSRGRGHGETDDDNEGWDENILYGTQ